MKSFLLLLVLLFMVMNNLVLAQPQQEGLTKRTFNTTSGQKFVDLCRASNDRARDYCGGVIISLMNAQIEMARIDPDLQIICPPRRLTVEEGRQVFLYWVDLTPKALTMDFPELAMQALRSRYRCEDNPDKVHETDGEKGKGK